MQLRLQSFMAELFGCYKIKKRNKKHAYITQQQLEMEMEMELLLATLPRQTIKTLCRLQ